jgi:sulfite reductase (NADPH) hemoprotein beta-component
MSTKAKARPATAPVVFTANRLRDGRVVWLGREGLWRDRIAETAPFAPETAEQGLALAQGGERAQQVVGVYAVEVDPVGPTPLKFRERLRVQGPSVAAEAA